MSKIKKLSFGGLLLLAIIAVSSTGQLFAAPFTPGNVVVCRVGDGSAALSSAATAIFLDEYTTAGGLVQSVPMPTVAAGANRAMTGAGSSTAECLISRSSNAQYILATGYDAPVGTLAIAGTASATFNRVVGRIDIFGNIDTSTSTTSFSANSIRSATSDNGVNLWFAGANTGVVYNTIGGSGAGTVVSSTITNNRALGVDRGQLYVSHGSGAAVGRLAAVGVGLPTMTGSTHVGIPGFPTSGSHYQYFFADLDAGVAGPDTLYVADDSTDVGGLGGVKKFSLVGGLWTANGTFPGNGVVLAGAIRGLAGTLVPGGVALYVTRNGNQLASYVDATGYNAAPTAVPTLLATPATNTAFRGIAFAPINPVAAGVTVGGRVTDAAGRGLGRVVVTLSGGELTQPLRTITSPLGYYLFDDLTVGSTYVMTVGSKQYTFSPNTRVISLTDAVTDIDFTADAPQPLIGPSVIRKR